MDIVLAAMAVLSTGIVAYILAKIGAKPALLAVVVSSVCLILVTIMILQKGEMIAQRANSLGALSYRSIPEAVREEDRGFLDDLFQKQNQDLPGIATAQNDSKRVPRAKLVVNSSAVKRAQLVVNNAIVKRAELVQPRRQ
jgi:hypothetical protein